MLFIEITKKELIGGHIKIFLIIEIAKFKLPVAFFGFMLVIEITNIELTGGQHWNYANYRDYQIEINPRAILDLCLL